MATGFLKKFEKDLEIIHAKYSKTIDGDVELLLSSSDLPEFTKKLDNPVFLKWCSSKPVIESSGHLLSPCLFSNSTNENDLDLYHNGRKRQNDFNASVFKEESTSSSSSDSDDTSGWSSDCSGPIKPISTAKVIRRRSKKKQNPLKSVSSPSDPLSKTSYDKRLSTKSNLIRGIVSDDRSKPFSAQTSCSDLLTAISEFRDLFLKSGICDYRKSRKRSKNLAQLVSPREKFSEVSRNSVGGRKNSRLTNGARRKIVETVEPGCVFEKLFVRSKGGSAHDMVEIASCSSYLSHSFSDKYQSTLSDHSQEAVKRTRKPSVINPVAQKKQLGNVAFNSNYASYDNLSVQNQYKAISFPNHSTPRKNTRLLSINQREPLSLYPEKFPTVFNEVDLPVQLEVDRPTLRFNSSQSSRKKQKEELYLGSTFFSAYERTEKSKLTPRTLYKRPPRTIFDAEEFDSPVSDRRSVPLRATPGHTSLCLSDLSPDMNRTTKEDESSISPVSTQEHPSPDSDSLSDTKLDQCPFSNGKQTQHRTNKSPMLKNGPKSSSISRKLEKLVDDNKITSYQNGRRSFSKRSVSRRRLYSPSNLTSTANEPQPNKRTTTLSLPCHNLECSELQIPIVTSPKESNLHSLWKEESSNRKRLKCKTTPRRRSTGFHPYKSPSLSSPLKALSLLSPFTGQERAARGNTVDKTTRRGSSSEVNSIRSGSLLSRLSKLKKGIERSRHMVSNNVTKVTGAMVTQDCSPGCCSKKICFNCSMDCSLN